MSNFLFTPETLPERTYNRVVSLVPSITETVVGLGLVQKLVGRTRFCTSSPEVLHRIPKVGGTKDPHYERIAVLQPDLIICVKEENRFDDVARLAQEFPCLVYDIQTISDTLEMLKHLGSLLKADPFIVDAYVQEIQSLLVFDVKALPKCLYLIWKDPYMTIGADTYISKMLAAVGLQLPNPSLRRYPEVNLNTIILEWHVDAILLSTEPYPFTQNHAKTMTKDLQIPVLLVDGQMLSWYGTLTAAGLRYGQKLNNTLLALL